MDAAGRPHVRIWRGDVYIERVPNAWLLVGTKADYDEWDDPAREFMIAKALKNGLDFELPIKSGKDADNEVSR